MERTGVSCEGASQGEHETPAGTQNTRRTQERQEARQEARQTPRLQRFSSKNDGETHPIKLLQHADQHFLGNITT